MAYKALYRTYRPQKFSEVIGQEAIVKTLQNALSTGKITHAYIFSGPRGTGKTTVARILAKAINCEKSPTSEPCGECISCKEISESNNPDVIEIDAASNNGVDEIRDIREKVKFLPGGSKYKIYIIDEVHMLSQGAFNALLKTLEEPPKHVIFILATTEPHKVIPTILSRCQRYDFKALSVKEITDLVEKVAKEEGIKISKEAIIAIAEGAEGGMRDALSYLDQAASFTDDAITIDDVNSVTGNLNYDKIIELARYFEDKQVNPALKTVNDLVILGKEINKIVSGMLQFYRDILLYKNIDTSMFSKYIYEKEEFRKLAQEIDINKIFYYVDILSDVQVKIKTTSTPHIYLEVALIKMINVVSSDLDYIQKIKALEEKIESLNISTNGQVLSIDDEKVNSVENKLNRVIAELSKLELHKLSDRVMALETGDVKEPVTSEANGKIDFLETEMKTINNKIDQFFNSGQTVQNHSLEAIENYVDDLVNNKISIPQHHEPNLDEIIDKIANLESKVYKLMSNALANQPASKKNKSKVNEGQIVLFGNEPVVLNDLAKPVKEKYDFQDHQKEEHNDLEKAVKEDDYEDENHQDEGNQNNIEHDQHETAQETKIVTEVEPFDQKDEEPIDTYFVEKNPDKEEDLTVFANKVNNNYIYTVNDFTEEEIKSESTKNVESLPNLSVSDFQKESDMHVIKKITDEAEIIQKPNSQLVRKLNSNKEKETIEEIKNKEDKPNVEPVSLVKPQPEVDEFSQYSVEIIERILHASRGEFARNDKIRIANLWRSLDKSVNHEATDIAELLQEGQVVAVGEREFIISYPNAALCNQVMKNKFKRESLKLLYDFLGESYNYIALPEELWKEKRMEYINQYNIGIRLPKLTPINDPNLNVENASQDFISHHEKAVNKAMRLFGENIVKIE